MKITYTSSNRAHHYPFVKALYRKSVLYAFVSGFSRFGHNSSLELIGSKLKRRDLIQSMFALTYKYNLPSFVSDYLNILSNSYLDKSSYKWAKESDFFIYYRTQGMLTTRKLKLNKRKTICVLEEVNSHIDLCHQLMKEEFEKLSLGKYNFRFPDHNSRLIAYNEADYILVPSEFERQSFLKKGFSASKIIKMNYGFDNSSKYLPELNNENNSFKVLYVGQLHFRKGLRYAIEAFKKIQHPNKSFVIVGNTTYVTGLENLAIPDNVIFTGPLKGENLVKQYKEADVFVLPSIEDGFGLVAGEALSYGLPVIVSSNCGACDVIIDGYNGYIVPPFNSDLIFEKFQNLADDRELLNQLSRNVIDSHYKLKDWDNVVSEFLNNLQKKQ